MSIKTPKLIPLNEGWSFTTLYRDGERRRIVASGHAATEFSRGGNRTESDIAALNASVAFLTGLVFDMADAMSVSHDEVLRSIGTAVRSSIPAQGFPIDDLKEV